MDAQGTHDSSQLTSTEIEEVILRVFKLVREDPSASYEPDRLLAFLTSPPASTGRRGVDTFAGRRRFVFMDGVQSELAVCFTNEEWQTGLGLHDLVKAVENKFTSPGPQMALAKKRVRAARASLIREPFKFGLLAACFLAIPVAVGNWILRVLLAAAWLSIVVVVAVMNVNEYRA